MTYAKAFPMGTGEVGNREDGRPAKRAQRPQRKDVLSPAWMTSADTFTTGCTLGRLMGTPSPATVAAGAIVGRPPEATAHDALYTLAAPPQFLPTVNAVQIVPQHVLEEKVRKSARHPKRVRQR